MKIKVGCDPELFLSDATGKIISAEGIVPGSKKEPVRVKKGMVQVDGFAAEFGIDPASSAEEFADNIETVLEELRRYTGDLKFCYQDHHVFDKATFEKQSHEGKALGCEPDFNAHTKLENPMPVPVPPTMRTAAGHVHIGWTEDESPVDPGHFMDCINIVKQMDWALGVPLLQLGYGQKRRALYGKAGAFRPKSYGCEYRTPDNAWVETRETMKLVFNNVQIGMDEAYKGKFYSNRYNASNHINRPDYYGSGIEYLGALKIPFIKKVQAEAEKPKKKAANYARY